MAGMCDIHIPAIVVLAIFLSVVCLTSLILTKCIFYSQCID